MPVYPEFGTVSRLAPRAFQKPSLSRCRRSAKIALDKFPYCGTLGTRRVLTPIRHPAVFSFKEASWRAKLYREPSS
jgi:hypothetical protein